MSNQDLFNHAFEYNFQAIVEYVNRGGNLNIMNDDGESLFCAFLEGYTNKGDTSPEEQRELESHSDDYDFWERHNGLNLADAFETKTPVRSVPRTLSWSHFFAVFISLVNTIGYLSLISS